MATNTNTQEQSIEVVAGVTLPNSQVFHDLKNAVLIVSAVANLAVLTAWIMLQVTSRYDASFASLLFQ